MFLRLITLYYNDKSINQDFNISINNRYITKVYT